MRINPKWLADIESQIIQDKEIDVITEFSVCQKALIKMLANFKRPFTTINLGCGVKRITTKTNICPKCNGTGRC